MMAGTMATGKSEGQIESVYCNFGCETAAALPRERSWLVGWSVQWFLVELQRGDVTNLLNLCFVAELQPLDSLSLHFASVFPSRCRSSSDDDDDGLLLWEMGIWSVAKSTDYGATDRSDMHFATV